MNKYAYTKTFNLVMFGQNKLETVGLIVNKWMCVCDYKNVMLK